MSAGRNSNAKGRTVMEVGSDGVTVIPIINPSVNSLSLDGANGKFSGGFDISAFGGLQSGKVEQPKPGFIAVDILTDTVAGTQWLPRLVGLTKSLEMMLTSKSVKGTDALNLGLVDAVVSSDKLLVKLLEEDIVEVVFFPVVNEACQVLDEDIAVKAADIDIAAVMGMGFPPYRGGIMFWADTLGLMYICSRLEEWMIRYGGFFKPCSYLADRAAKGLPLSSPSSQAQSRL